jgi:hypothetical protein
MTRQEMFDKMVSHLREQKAFSVNPGSLSCLYRSVDGNKCAIGALIPDYRYNPAFEGIGVRHAMFDFIEADYSFLCAAQSMLHDSMKRLAADWNSKIFEAQAAFLAETYNLEYTNE